jgi:hypothetical protein
MPKQLESRNLGKIIKEAVEVLKNTVQDTMVIVVSINAVFLVGISLIWSFINSLELILYLPLINLSFPASIIMIYSIFIPISTIDIIPEGVTLWLFNLSSDVKNNINPRTQSMSIESTITFINLGSNFYFLLITIIVYSLIVIFYKRISFKVLKYINKKN